MFDVDPEILGTVPVDPSEEQRHADLSDVHRRHVSRYDPIHLGRRFGNQPHLQQSFDRLGRQFCRNAVLFRKCVGRIGFFARFEPFDDEVHHRQQHEVAVSPADVFGLLFKVELADILVGESQFGSEQADEPRQLEPHQQQRQCGKTPVDRVVFGDSHLTADIDHLDDLERDAGKDSGEQGAAEPNFRVRHVHIEKDEHQNRNQVRNGVCNRCDGPAGQVSMGSRVQQNRKTGIADQQYGHNDHQSQIIRELPDVGPVPPDLPDFVEIAFDFPKEAEYGVEQHHDADTEKESALGIFDRPVDKFHDPAKQGLLSGKVAEKLALQDVLESESSGDGEQYGQHRYEGEQGAVGQGSGADVELCTANVANREDKAFQQVVQSDTFDRTVDAADAPEVIGKKTDGIDDPAFDRQKQLFHNPKPLFVKEELNKSIKKTQKGIIFIPPI